MPGPPLRRGVVMITVVVSMMAAGCTGGASTEAFCERLSKPPPSDPWADVDLIVHIDPEADDGQVNALRGWLDDDTQIEVYTWVDQQQVHDEFVDLFASSPEMIEAVGPELLPERAMVRVRDADPEVAEQIGRQLENRPGVYRVTLRPTWDTSVIARNVQPLAEEDIQTSPPRLAVGRSRVDLAAVAPASMRESSQVLDDYWAAGTSPVSAERLDAVGDAASQVLDFYDAECG